MSPYTAIMAGRIATVAAGAAFSAPSEVTAGGDTIRLEPHPDHPAQLVYSNSARSLTKAGTFHLCLDEVCVSVTLNTALRSPHELVTVAPADGYLAVPPEAVVRDGDSVTVLIVWPMF